MTLERYVEMRKAELDAFQKHWNDNQASGEIGYQCPPAEADDWFEQEIAYISIYTGRPVE